MSERDKLIAQAEALETAAHEWQMAADEFGTMHKYSAMFVAEDLREDAKELRALAAQQEPVGEPTKCGQNCIKRCLADIHGCPSECPSLAWRRYIERPQASAPADHTAADAPNREAGSSAATHGPSQVGNSSAVGVTPDLDALVAALGYQKQIDEDGTFVSVSRQAVCEAAQAITDLRAEVERAKTQRDEAWKAFTRLRRAYSMVRYPTLTEELRLLYDAADAVAAGKGEEKS